MKQKLTKEERRKKYTDIARKRRQKLEGRKRSFFGGGNGNGGSSYNNNVCYLCRKPGHKVSQCPLSDSNNNNINKEGNDHQINNHIDKDLIDTENTTSSSSSSAICFKCGSPEHSLSECPKLSRYEKQSKEYGNLPYATCFLCKQTGHLASACPTNKRGIYINGGSCRVCGSQYHLVTDCPEKKKKKAEKEPKFAEEINEDELIETPKVKKTSKKTKEPTKKKRRVVKF